MKAQKTLFLHGYESSGQGTKGRFFTDNFPEVASHDYLGSLEARMQELEKNCTGADNILLIGSSYGGLMATIFALAHPERVAKLILLAPALNYGDYQPPSEKLPTPTIVIVGKNDTITPVDLVVPLAENTFENLEIRIVDDDHMLHKSFEQLKWQQLLAV